jgi:hypothetical protein
LTVLIPDHVIAALNALPPRADVHPDYFFWSGNSKHKSLTGRWQRKLERLCTHALDKSALSRSALSAVE